MTAPALENKAGRLRRTTTVLTSAGITTFAYDFESRATSITGLGISQTNVYNGLDIEAERISRRAPRIGGREMSPDLSGGIGTRIGSTTNSVAQTYLRDGAYVTDPVLKDSSATYTPGVSERRGSATTFLHSGLKNADAQTGTTQTVSATRRYDAFGNVTTSSGIWNGPFGYAGGFGYQEDATGLKLLGHRYYDSSTGRFLTRDPIKDGRNWFVYCGNDPVRCFDILGLRAAWFQVAVGVIVPLLSGGISGSIGRDLGSGHWGLKVEGGLGVGFGISGGMGISGNYEGGGKINGNKWDSGKAVGGSAAIVNAEVSVDDGGNVTGVGGGIGVGPQRGIGWGVYGEWRLNYVLDLTETWEWIHDRIAEQFPRRPEGWLMPNN